MPKAIVILKTGGYTDAQGRNFVITEELLEDIALSTEPLSAPLVKGHPQSEAPALGWVQELKVQGGKLWAVFGKLSQAFAYEVKQGAFRNVSASFFLPEASSNPVPGHYCLRHVAALGAARPAVPGLGTLDEAVSFSEGLVSIKRRNKRQLGEEFMETEKERELRENLEQCAAERDRWKQCYEELINLNAVQAEVSKLEEAKEMTQALREGLVKKALALVQNGQRPDEAVAAFGEFLPPKMQRQHSRLEGKASLPGIAQFSEGSAVFGEGFAAQKSAYEKQGFSPSEAYDRAAKDMGF